jgi:hypothetical protein
MQNAKDRMGKTRIILAVLLGTLLSAPAAVSAQTVQPTASRGGQPAVSASLVIEQFLRASNANELETMARLFGNRDGAVSDRDPRAANEQRMFALASILRHEDYRIEGNEIVPGRSDEATRVKVRLTINSQSFAVPFTLVNSKKGKWLIEQIGIEEITSRR